MLKKGDIFIIITALLLIALSIAFIWMPHTAGAYVKVSVNNQEYCTCPLDEDTAKTIDIDGNINVLIIKDGKAYISDANCRDKICVHHKSIDSVGDAIVCLPHGLVVEVVSEE